MSEIDELLIIVEGLIRRIKQDSKPIEEHEVLELLEKHNMLGFLEGIDREIFIKKLLSRIEIKMDRGICLKNYNHRPWYNAYKSTKDKFPFWERYYKYLIEKKNFSRNVMRALDESTDEIMDMLANPETEENFSRRGLIIGDVQSGKTATYIALINKAADAGYKAIILLTGTIEKLRQQTQGRIDEGFTGKDSKDTNLINGLNTAKNSRIGVGAYIVNSDEENISAISFTSVQFDFNKQSHNSIISGIKDLGSPVIFVVKKNKTILEKLQQWILKYSLDNGVVNVPMLMIDDEADAASINTNNDETNPTAINRAIRSILNLFVRSNYVAFTATPYANIFINPDSSDEMLKDDLFPKDFIYSLNSPTNYIGASSIFVNSEDEDGNEISAKYNYMLHNNDDCEEFIPMKHKKDFIPSVLPESLKEAIASFLIVNAIRDLRGHDNTHRTMLINVSRFINVQNKLTDIVKEYITTVIEEIRNYYRTECALKHSHIAFIKNVYDKYYKDLEVYKNSERYFTWNEIQKNLYAASASIKVSNVNGGNASKTLDYDSYEKGMRLIAVGGFSLSRGLTLEGLAVSYFYRNSQMYDTLMQMGRWFGYRNGYEDLCQIWMTSFSQEWYSYIAEATEELRNDITVMHNANKTPKDFGLQVRTGKDSLLVTAINKMRTAQEYEYFLSLSGLFEETAYIAGDIVENKRNLEAVENLVTSLIKSGYKYLHPDKELALSKPQFLDIPKSKIIEFLSLYNASSCNKFTVFNSRNGQNHIVDMLKESNDPVLNLWDILIATGKGDICNIGEISINKVVRGFNIEKLSSNKTLVFKISGSNLRLGTALDAKGGITKEQVAQIEENYRNILPYSKKNKSISGKAYFKDLNVKRNPLLIIYPVQLKEDASNEDIINIFEKYKNEILTGIAVAIPVFDGDKIYSSGKYIINKIKMKEYGFIDEDDYDDYDEDETFI